MYLDTLAVVLVLDGPRTGDGLVGHSRDSWFGQQGKLLAGLVQKRFRKEVSLKRLHYVQEPFGGSR